MEIALLVITWVKVKALLPAVVLLPVWAAAGVLWVVVGVVEPVRLCGGVGAVCAPARVL